MTIPVKMTMAHMDKTLGGTAEEHQWFATSASLRSAQQQETRIVMKGIGCKREIQLKFTVCAFPLLFH